MRKVTTTLQSYLPSVFGKPSKLPPSVLKEIKAKQAEAKSKAQAKVSVPTPAKAVSAPVKNDVPVVDVKQSAAKSLPAVDVKQPSLPSLTVDSIFVDSAGRTIGAKCDRFSVMECNDDDFIAIMNQYGFTQIPLPYRAPAPCADPNVSMPPRIACSFDNNGGPVLDTNDAAQQPTVSPTDDGISYIYLNQCNTTEQTISGQTANSIRTAIWDECDRLLRKQDAQSTLFMEIFFPIVGGAFLIFVAYKAINKCVQAGYLQPLINCFQRCKRDQSNAHLQSQSARAGLLVHSQSTQDYSSVTVGADVKADAAAGEKEASAAATTDSTSHVAAFSIASS